MQQQACKDERVRLLTCEQLLDAFQAKAAAAAAAAAAAGGTPAHTSTEVWPLISCAWVTAGSNTSPPSRWQASCCQDGLSCVLLR
jgi:hypothetical protein